MINVNTTPGAHTHAPGTTTEISKGLLACGIASAALFVGASLVQALFRQGFDLTRHPISLLILGDLGWVQIANFVLSGLLAIAAADGMWRVLHPDRGGTWGPLLIGLYGVGLIAAGVFAPDPAFGFPPGTPEGVAAVMSRHSMLHGVAFFVSLPSLIAACFVFARRFFALRRRGWAGYCIATGAAAPIFIVLSSMNTAGPGAPLFIMAIVNSVWLALVSMRLLAEQNTKGSR